MLGNFEKKRPLIFINENIANYSDYSAIRSVLFVSANSYITLLQRNTISAFTSLIAESKMFPVHNIDEIEDNTEDVVIFESKHKQRVKSQNGKNRFAFQINVDIDYFIQLKKLEGLNLNAYFGDVSNNLIGYSDGVNFKPLTIDSIIVKKIPFGSVKSNNTVIIVDLHDSNEVNYIYKPLFIISDIILEEVYFSSISKIDATTLQFTIKNYCNEEIIDFIQSNFTLIDNIQGLLSIHTFTNVGAGVYRIKTNEIQYSGIISVKNSKYFGNDDYSFSIPQYNPTQYNNAQYSI